MAYYRESYTFTDAVETLSALAEIEGWEDPMDLHVDEEAIPEEDKGARERAIDWLQEHDGESTLGTIRRLFRVIQAHLERFAESGAFAPSQRHNRRRVRSLMVVVGEAAQKLDHFLHLFHGARVGSVTGLEEYRALQRFYLANLASEQRPSEVEPGFLQVEPATNELDRICEDHDYELLYIRGQDGLPYVTPGLEETIKLACDFHIETEEYEGRDPLIYLQDWKDHLSQLRALEIYSKEKGEIESFFVSNYSQKQEETVGLFAKAVIALTLAANPRNLLRYDAVKTCYQYFGDFVKTLRLALESRGYGVALSLHGAEETGASQIVRLANALCYQLFTTAVSHNELQEVMADLIKEGGGAPSGGAVWEHLRAEYTSVGEVLKRHPNGPLFKALDLIRERPFETFDPMNMGNYPDCFYTLTRDGEQTTIHRLPTPTSQPRVDQAQITPEFLSFLRALKAKGKRLLLINNQHRASWKELARAEALEGLSARGREMLVVVTLSKNTEFYHQRGIYHDEDRWTVFSGQLRHEIESNERATFLPSELSREIMTGFFDGALGAVRRLFFGGAHRLSHKERQDFLEIFQLLLELKLIDLVRPDICGYVSKDGIDTTCCNTARTYIGLKLLRGESLVEEDWRALREQLFMPAFLERERLIMTERWERFLSAIKRMEEGAAKLWKEGRAHQIQEELGPLFESDMVHAELRLPKSGSDIGPLIL